MPESINLIPQSERVAQAKTKVVKFSTILSVLIFIVVAGFAGYFYYRTNTVKNELYAVESDIVGLRNQVSEMNEIEINARNLYKKSTALMTIFDTRVHYSVMMERIKDSTPKGIVIDSFNLGKDNTLSISGRADTYNDVQEFTNRLLGKELFSNVELKSVGLENRQDKVNFFIVVSYKVELLRD